MGVGDLNWDLAASAILFLDHRRTLKLELARIAPLPFVSLLARLLNEILKKILFTDIKN